MADHHAAPVPGQLRLECRLVELGIAESGERRGLSAACSR